MARGRFGSGSGGGPRLPGGRGGLAGIGAVVMAVLFLGQQALEEGGVERLLALLAGDGPLATAASPDAAPADAPFDYYVLALSWSPSFCIGRPDADQCDAGRRFILHGLWPQYERGFPTDCETAAERPSRRLLGRYADLTESPGLLAHQWRKHGTCTGLSAEDYLAASAAAVERVRLPQELTSITENRNADPRAIEAAFVRGNPGFEADGVTIKCRDNRLSEVRICLTRSLTPRACGRDVIRDCGANRIAVPAPK